MLKRTAIILTICLFGGLSLSAGETTYSDINWKIRQEETDHSQIMRLVHQLTDVFGPRLTGSPNFQSAGEWSIEQMKQWGMQNGHVENWDFGHPGWNCEKQFVRVVSPYQETLNVRVVAWTPGTHGVIRANVVQLDLPDHPTEENLTAYLNGVKEKIRDKIVLVGTHTQVPLTLNTPNKRREDSELRAQYDPSFQEPLLHQKTIEPLPDTLKPLDSRDLDQRIDSFLQANGALAKVTDAAREHGQIRVFGNFTYSPNRTVPSIVIRNEDYGRISRILADNTSVEMEVEIATAFLANGPTSFNAIAEIPGTDIRHQVVILGAHIDSWHAGTGATDNAAGVAVVMEAARILQKLGIKPRRTIRVILWGGEEQGLLGSKAYVKEHYGAFETQKLAFNNLSAYLNIDLGTGRIRGASVFGPPEAAAVLRQIFAPFQDLGVIGANSIKSRSYGGTDSTAFNWAGLPAINMNQDPIEYFSHSWHTDLDTYERVQEEDLKQCAIVIASAAYHLAMREEMLPRFSGDSMPPPEK